MFSWFWRVFSTVFYGLIGLFLAWPISYFFQDDLYREMTWQQYTKGGLYYLKIGAEFGAVDVYRYTVFFSMIITILLGKSLEHYLKTHIKKSD